ncbi:polygalacturonase inhibitor-like [Impatiens glandulifera]|uniref:polygalacturonase inhibitor-like n=1 Tax=Impatiens glandulifera TaxID=253017 RepID=UPI001FB137FD|nr:polygalacturonase inhibitor-like [Impatiens glandulifera]
MKIPTPLVLILLLCLQSASAISGAAVRCSPQDKKVLLQIKKDLGNPYHLSSWNTEIQKDCSDWYSLDCDLKTNRVIALTIFQSNLSGQIPPSVGDLSYLQQIVFHKLPNLVGTIPQTITKLTHLRRLDVSWTNISGPIPDFISQLNNLNTLDLSFNYLTGNIPSSLSELANLNYLNLHGNKLTGSIPDSFGKFKRNPNLYLIFALTSLDINHNNIYGSLPQGLTFLNLQFLNVSYNRLCGQIPVGGQLQSFETTVYFHNRCLCGAPLPACK